MEKRDVISEQSVRGEEEKGKGKERVLWFGGELLDPGPAIRSSRFPVGLGRFCRGLKSASAIR